MQKIEIYNKAREGILYKTVWRLEIKKLENLQHIPEIAEEVHQHISSSKRNEDTKRFIDITCPSNDHPILQIPKDYRRAFLEELIPDKSFKRKLFNSKEYQWVLKGKPCSICSAIYNILLDKLGEPLEVFNMLHARNLSFDRQFGRGISIFNPGDNIIRNQ